MVFTCWKWYSPGDIISLIVYVIKQLQTFVSVNMSFYWPAKPIFTSAFGFGQYYFRGQYKLIFTSTKVCNCKMFDFKKYDRQNHVWSFMTKYLRFLCKFTSWSGETHTGNFSDAFLSWTRIMSVLIGWPI